MSEKFEAVFYFFLSPGKGLVFIDTDTGFKALVTTKWVFIRIKKNKFWTKAEPEILRDEKQRW